MAAVRELHAHHGVAGLQEGEVDGRVRLAAAVGLDVRVLRAEERLRPVAGEVLHHVDHLAAAVVAGAGIPFRVLVGEHARHRLAHRERGDVLARDELEVGVLARLLVPDQAEDRRVGLGERDAVRMGGEGHRGIMGEKEGGFAPSPLQLRATRGFATTRTGSGRLASISDVVTNR